MLTLEYDWATPLDFGGIQTSEAEAGLGRAAKGGMMSAQQLRAVVTVVHGGTGRQRAGKALPLLLLPCVVWCLQLVQCKAAATLASAMQPPAVPALLMLATCRPCRHHGSTGHAPDAPFPGPRSRPGYPRTPLPYPKWAWVR